MEESSSSVQVVIPPKESFAKEWSSDQKAFKGVPWGKAMMWIFLVSDTFVFSIFLISYMTVDFLLKLIGQIQVKCSVFMLVNIMSLFF